MIDFQKQFIGLWIPYFCQFSKSKLLSFFKTRNFICFWRIQNTNFLTIFKFLSIFKIETFIRFQNPFLSHNFLLAFKNRNFICFSNPEFLTIFMFSSVFFLKPEFLKIFKFWCFQNPKLLSVLKTRFFNDYQILIGFQERNFFQFQNRIQITIFLLAFKNGNFSNFSKPKF